MHQRLLVGAVLLLGIALGFFLSSPHGTSHTPAISTPSDMNPVFTNQSFIEGLYTEDLNLSDDESVFTFVFSRLPDEVVVYPTENYYYFKLYANGQTIGGTFSLPADSRDEGRFGFGYIERLDDPSDIRLRSGGGIEFEPDGLVSVTKVEEFVYDVSYYGKTVRFHLNVPPLTPPAASRLSPVETFVGPILDESGIGLHLIFNEQAKKMYMLLNQDEYVPDRFFDIGNSILIGERSRWAFYDDVNYNRKILIGVYGPDTLQNNWLDGPHDQMPDNYIYSGQIPRYREFLEAHYPQYAGKIDSYGNFLEEEGARIAVAPYRVYFSYEELRTLVADCKASFPGGSSLFYACLTEQVFDVPDDYYASKTLR